MPKIKMKGMSRLLLPKTNASEIRVVSDVFTHFNHYARAIILSSLRRFYIMASPPDTPQRLDQIVAYGGWIVLQQRSRVMESRKRRSPRQPNYTPPSQLPCSDQT